MALSDNCKQDEVLVVNSKLIAELSRYKLDSISSPATKWLPRTEGTIRDNKGQQGTCTQLVLRVLMIDGQCPIKRSSNVWRLITSERNGRLKVWRRQSKVPDKRYHASFEWPELNKPIRSYDQEKTRCQVLVLVGDSDNGNGNWTKLILIAQY